MLTERYLGIEMHKLNKIAAADVTAGLMDTCPHPSDRRAESGEGQRQRHESPPPPHSGEWAGGGRPTREWPDSAAGEEIPRPQSEVYHNSPRRWGSEPSPGNGAGS